MKTPTRLLLAPAVLLLSLAGCRHREEAGGVDTERRVDVVAALGREFTLSKGGTARVGDLTVTFATVLEDSRCPRGVQCVRAGNARIGVVAREQAFLSEVLALNTDEGVREGEYRDYVVQLAKLEPLPEQGGGEALEYRATLVVRRREAGG